VKNLWIQTDNAFATWRADLTAVQRRPQAVLGLVQVVLDAGAAHRMYEVVEAPLIGYRRERDGALGAVLARLFAEQGVLDAFGFVGSAMLPGAARSSTVETLLALYDREDRVVEKAVSDLGAELKAMEPVEDVIPDGFMMHYPAVRVLGRQFVGVRDGELLDRSAHPLPVSVRIELHSDVWFPWVFGSAHPEADHKRMFDNRELCSRHTPRLNAFLAAVGEATRAAGGTFGIDPDAGIPRARLGDERRRTAGLGADAGCVPRRRARRRVVLKTMALRNRESSRRRRQAPPADGVEATPSRGGSFAAVALSPDWAVDVKKLDTPSRRDKIDAWTLPNNSRSRIPSHCRGWRSAYGTPTSTSAWSISTGQSFAAPRSRRRESSGTGRRVVLPSTPFATSARNIHGTR
jgi:hypothetical protein